MEEFQALVDQIGCGQFYWKSEECLNNNGREMRRCQKELGDFARCFAANSATKKSQLQARLSEEFQQKQQRNNS